MNTFLISLIFSLATVNASTNLKTGYRYIDGSNNTYFIWGKEIKYDPITKENSSSGEYDGGEPKTVRLKKEQSDKLYQICNEALNDKTSHIETRLMGCGTLVKIKKSGNETVYLGMKSDAKEKIDTYLKELMQ